MDYCTGSYSVTLTTNYTAFKRVVRINLEYPIMDSRSMTFRLRSVDLQGMTEPSHDDILPALPRN
jgi:hypothetical protein